MKKLKILVFIGLFTAFAACKSTKSGTGSQESGGQKSGIVDLTVSFIKDKKHPWKNENLMSGQYILDGTISLNLAETTPSQWVDENGVFHIEDKKLQDTYTVKDGTHGVIDTIIGKTLWIKFDDGGTFRWFSFTPKDDDRFYFTPGKKTVMLDGQQYNYTENSKSAKLKIIVDKSEPRDGGKKAVAPGVTVGGGGGNNNQDDSTNTNSNSSDFGADPFNSPANGGQKKDNSQNDQQQNQQQNQNQPSKKSPGPPPKKK